MDKDNPQVIPYTAEPHTVYEIDDVEVFRTGTWNGDEYTPEDLDAMVAAHQEIGHLLKPYLKLGHAEKQGLLQKDGFPAAGWITNLRRQGNSLVAKITHIPQKIYQLIQSKAYGRLSSEVYWNLNEGGKKYTRALRAVALLGGDTPAVWSMDDFIGLYTTDDSNFDHIKTVEYSENEMDEQMVKEYTDKLKALEEQNQALTEENEALKKFKTDLETQALKKDVDIMVEKALADGKIVPAVAPMFAALAMNEGPGARTYSFKEGEEEKTVEYSSNLDLIRQIIENSPKASMFEEKTQDIQPEPKKNKKAGDPLMDDETAEKALKIMTEKKVSYREALAEVLREE